MLGSAWDTSLRPRSGRTPAAARKSSVLHKPITGTQVTLLLRVAHHHDIKSSHMCRGSHSVAIRPVGRRHPWGPTHVRAGWGRRDDENRPILGYNVVADESELEIPLGRMTPSADPKNRSTCRVFSR